MRERLLRHFPELSEAQLSQFETMMRLYPEWNAKINVISRKDIDNLFVNHILHSLVIASFLGRLEAGTTFMDLGTGGGFPGVPLAVMYPDCRFHLIDRIAKKLRVAEDIARQAGLENITFQHGDAGECHDRFDYVVSRAVMPLNELVRIAVRNVSAESPAGNRYQNGIIALKGGDLAEELALTGRRWDVYEISHFFDEEFFATKKVVHTAR